MKVHSRSGFRRIDKIRLNENISRVLNLLFLEKELSGEPVVASDEAVVSPASAANAGRFFHNKILNRAVFLKHNLRPNETRLFANHGHVETKVLIPIDGNRLECGAQSFFIGERSYPLVVREVLKMTPDDPDEVTSRDLKILNILRSISAIC